MNYRHTQTAPLYWILLGTSLMIMVVTVGLAKEEIDPGLGLMCGIIGALLVVLAFCFKSLTVEDGGDHLLVYFGPIPAFRKRIPYRQISDVKPSRSRFIDGWGIHYGIGRGWTWNLWGFDCVEMRVNGRKLRIGTDEPEELTCFLVQATRHLG